MSYNVVVENGESTVVTEYKPVAKTSSAYQSEAALEAAFIDDLQKIGYEYLPIHTEKELLNNLRKQLSALNNYEFSDSEWERFYSSAIDNKTVDDGDRIKEKTRTIQEDYKKSFKSDKGTVNIDLIDKTNIHRNKLQVINQYEETGGSHETRYDVTILVNGLPLVHIELKRRGVDIRQAFNQINRYQRTSFWAGCGLFEYVQIFVISNGTYTKYYSNTTRFNHVKESNSGKVTKTSNSFEFTSYWADAKNNVIADLIDFTQTFFSRHTILNLLTKYCVFTAEKMLIVMRPYQIVATERILERIEYANNNKIRKGTKAGGYIWHTTGSGKTLTSFKTAQLATQLEYVDKVLFVVDRKDLDYQTMREYDRFQKGAANGNTSTKILQGQLESDDDDKKIIITTIQKLSRYVTANPDKKNVYDKHYVIIFDECHRSQFGDMHKLIESKFKNYNMFGFTGTPIFAKNANTSIKGTNAEGNAVVMTTEQTFGDCLHAYTIVSAIRDKNVLPFKIEYIKTMDKEPDIDDGKVRDIEREKNFLAPKRIREVTKYILDKFYKKTRSKDEKIFKHTVTENVSEVVSSKMRDVKEEKRVVNLNGFNSIFAVASIEAAKKYYAEFKKQIAALKDGDPKKKLKIALIYSFAANEEEGGDTGFLDEENSDCIEGLDKTSCDFLNDAIKDYNEYFHVSYDTSADKFPNYYKDVSLRMKNREIDILIVVNMFLTGFDATTLNTLWVDKNVRMHGLIQSFSRTNRILNSVKPYGNIVYFRNLQNRTDEAIALFGDENAKGIVLVRSFEDYYNGYKDRDDHQVKGYSQLVKELRDKFPAGDVIIGSEAKQKEFIKLYGSVLHLYNILSAFDDFEHHELMDEYEMQNYTGMYVNLWHEYINKKNDEKEDIMDDLVFEIEIVRQIEVNVDYILELVKKYHKSNCTNTKVREYIDNAIDSSPDLRSKKELIDEFIDSLNKGSDIMAQWLEFIATQSVKQLKDIINEENLNPRKTEEFMNICFKIGEFRSAGTAIDNIMPPLSIFGGNRITVKERVTEKMSLYFERFYGLVNVVSLAY